MEALLTIGYIVLFSTIIYKIRFFQISGVHRFFPLSIFYIKILASIALTLIYTYYYTDRLTADIYKYFDDSKVMFDAIYDSPSDFFRMISGIGNDTPHFDKYYAAMNNWTRVYESNIYNDSHTIIRFNALLRFFSFGYFYVHNVFMCFFSFWGLMCIFKVANMHLNNCTWLLILGIFLMPSTIFWSSGVLKEGLLFFAIGMMLYHLHLILFKQFTFISLGIMLFFSFLMMYLKLYVLLCLLPLIIAFVWIQFSNKKFIELKYIAVLSIYFLIGFNIYRIFPGYNALEILVLKQTDFFGLAESMQSGSLLNIAPLKANFLSLLQNAPMGFFNTLLRPHLLEAKNPLILLAAIENIMIIMAIIFTFIYRKKDIKITAFLYLCLFFTVLIFTLTGLITPVMGAMVRYKVPALPFLMIFLIALVDTEKLSKSWKKFIKIDLK